VADLHAPIGEFPERHGSGLESRTQRLALEQLGHEKRTGVRGPHVVEREQIGMIQRADRPYFLFEATQPIRIVREEGRQDLDRDVASEARSCAR